VTKDNNLQCLLCAVIHSYIYGCAYGKSWC